jgi:cell division protein FtsL
MSAVDFEYAIKKDVRNNPIVREVDQARQRQLWRSLGMGGVLVVVLLFSTWQHFELVDHGYKVQRLEKERAAEMEINRHLTLQVETLRSPARIEELAKKMKLFAPTRQTAIIIERAAPSAPPDRSVLASR